MKWLAKVVGAMAFFGLLVLVADQIFVAFDDASNLPNGSQCVKDSECASNVCAAGACTQSEEEEETERRERIHEWSSRLKRNEEENAAQREEERKVCGGLCP